ncbi:MAPEG family protein [Delftia sp. PS-11]|uniref:MAPEG family protein n=1 Tax=Delftia sp. PS-11 TaxID=2767222 RepID=UPI002455CDD2|nr:MAPEG family protein [Delftia sp. PS-11]KAJ8744381.1 MAPEG family protein [Delftia sp. PS-11]
MPSAVILPQGGFSVAHWCLLVAVLLPLVCAYIAKASGLRRGLGPGGFDNHDPRAWLARQSGYQARANAAQANSFEALPFFIGALVVAWQLDAPAAWVNGLAVAFVLLRVAYIACYVLDRASLRSAAWVLGWCVNLLLFFAGYR